MRIGFLLPIPLLSPTDVRQRQKYNTYLLVLVVSCQFITQSPVFFLPISDRAFLPSGLMCKWGKSSDNLINQEDITINCTYILTF